MKKITLIVCLFLSISLSAGKITVSATKAKIGSGTNDAFTVMIFEANVKEVVKAWKKEMKSYDVEKVKKGSNDVFADNVKLKDVFVNPMDVYAIATQVDGEGVEFVIGVDMGGAYMNKAAHPKEFAAMAKLIEEFALKQVKEAVKNQIEAAEKVLKQRQNEQEDLVKDKAKLEKKIEGWKTDIQTAEKNIETNTSNQEKKKAEIEAQKAAVEAVKKKESEY